jgi:hypothetical protein
LDRRSSRPKGKTAGEQQVIERALRPRPGALLHFREEVNSAPTQGKADDRNRAGVELVSVRRAPHGSPEGEHSS